jgi:epoxide hydrolase 4
MPEHHDITTNGIRLHVVTEGPEGGAPVLMLHGFPQSWRTWSRQFDALAAAGYRVIAPDQRGYNQSEKPAAVRAYEMDILIRDILGLLDTLKYDRVELVGHDWGGVVALHFAEAFPERVKHLIISNATHSSLMARTLGRKPGQMLKSWYILFFQLPLLPEYFMRYSLNKRAARSSKREGASEEAKQVWAIGDLTPMINWYRAAFRKRIRTFFGDLLRLRNPFKASAMPVITPPTLILWGSKDTFLTPELAKDLAEVCQDVRVEYFPDGTHWLPADQPEAVAQRILEFIK